MAISKRKWGRKKKTFFKTLATQQPSLTPRIGNKLPSPWHSFYRYLAPSTGGKPQPHKSTLVKINADSQSKKLCNFCVYAIAFNTVKNDYPKDYSAYMFKCIKLSKHEHM